MNVNETINNYREFINNGYSNWLNSAQTSLQEHGEFLDENFCDWAQANWELLVERTICKSGQFLEIYGSGSDYEAGLHARVFFRDKLPTHRIRCISEERLKAKYLINILN